MGKKSLGRGLSAIFSEVSEAYDNDFGVENVGRGEILELPINEIEPNPYQPRKIFDEKAIEELSESIKRHGLLQPVTVLEVDGRYILVAGERRLRATKAAGMETIKAIVAEVDERKLRELALIENVQREDLNPIELARSYKELIEEYSITQEELAKTLNKSRSHIANTLRLLQLDDYVAEKVLMGYLSQGHAKVLVNLGNEEQRLVCDTVIGQKLSVRETEKLVAGMKRNGKRKRETGSGDYLDLRDYGRVILENIPFDNVKVKRDKIEFYFKNEMELKTFLKNFRKIYQSE